MLVLSRRLNEKLLLPDLHVAVQVVSIRPGQVRLGIDAPPHVQVLRAEIAGQYPPARSAQPARQAVAGQLNAANASVSLLRRQLAAGMIQDAQATLERLARDFSELQGELAAACTPAPPTPVATRQLLQPLPTEDVAVPVVKEAALVGSRV